MSLLEADLVTIVIKRANDLKGGGGFTGRHPYCVLHMGEQSSAKKTKSLKGTSPCWDETFSHTLSSDKQVISLLIKVMDKGLLKKDVSL